MIINNKEYKPFESVYFIAEIGINHNGSLEIAKRIIRRASLFRASAVKFQKRSPEKIWTEEYLNKPYNTNYSFGKTYGEHKAFLEFNDEQYFELKKIADKYDIDFLVTAFDVDNLDFVVNELEVPAIKIASPFITHIPFIKKAAEYDLPLFISTGMHNIEEIDKAVEILQNNNSKFILMQCTSLYPLDDDQVNLRVMQTYLKKYKCEVGYSGHDRGVVVPAVAAALGAIAVEKHFTIDRTMRGPDHALSLEERGLDLSIKYLNIALKCLGSSEKRILEGEWESRKKYCFSLKAIKDIKIGEKFTEDNLIFKSPRIETNTDYYSLLGTKAKKNYKKDENII